MVRKTGNWFLFFFAIISQFCLSQHPELMLSVTKTDHAALSYIGRHQPFFLVATAKNIKNVYISERDIPASQTCTIVGNGQAQSTTIINGAREDSLIFNFIVHATKEGQFSFGPIVVKAPDGTEIVSNKITVTVSDNPLVHKAELKPFIFTASVDKKQLFAHEKVIVSYQFYYRHNFEQLEIFEQNYADCVVGFRSQDASQKIKNIDGQEYYYKERIVEIYPQSPGTVTILPARALFFNASQRRGIFGFGFLDRTELYSHAVEINVLPLPKHPEDRKVEAVGVFDSVSFSIEHDVADVGTGISAKYEIVGDGNLGIVQFPKLEVPESIRCYSSTESIKKIDDKKRKKIFEVVVQGGEPGAFDIPAQRFDYFDVEAKKYKTLWTKPMAITFTGESLVQKKTETAEENNNGPDILVEHEIDETRFEDWQIKNIYHGSAIHANSNQKVSEDWFLMLLFLLVLSLIAWNAQQIFYSYFDKISQFVWFQKKYALFRLNKIKKSRDVRSLHALFEFVFKHYAVDIYHASGVEIWDKIGGSTEDKALWKKFIDELHGAIYMNSFDYNYDLLHEEAKRVIILFYKRMERSRSEI